jgi:hypothetical protein
MRAPINAVSLVGLVSFIAVGRAGAQIRTPIATPRLAPAPAPVLAAADQQTHTIWPLIRFDLPTNAVAIRVSRQQAGGTSVLLTPTDIPVASVSKVNMADGWHYVWPDNTLTALGSYSYSVADVLDDGRVGVSGWLPYTPQVYEPTNVTVQKTSSFSAVVSFTNSFPVPARTYRLFGTRLVTYGFEATKSPYDKTGRSWTVQLDNLPAGTYNWILRGEFDPGIRSNGVPVSVTLP